MSERGRKRRGGKVPGRRGRRCSNVGKKRIKRPIATLLKGKKETSRHNGLFDTDEAGKAWNLRMPMQGGRARNDRNGKRKTKGTSTPGKSLREDEF